MARRFAFDRVALQGGQECIRLGKKRDNPRVHLAAECQGPVEVDDVNIAHVISYPVAIGLRLDRGM